MAKLSKLVGNRTRLLRKAAGLTQEKLAQKVGIDPKYLGAVERGEKSPSLVTLERIASALNVNPYELLLAERELSHSTGKDAERQLRTVLRRLGDGEKDLLALIAQKLEHLK